VGIAQTPMKRQHVQSDDGGTETMAETLATRTPRRWSTEDVDQRRALAYWVDTVCDHFIELDIDTPLRTGFRACLDQTDLGVATANFVQAELQRIHRTRARIARAHERAFVLLQIRSGQVCLSQFGREALVRSGECVLMDSAEPYKITCPQAHRGLALRLPEHWLKRWLPHPESLTARVLTGAGWSSALNAALASIELESCDDLALPRGVVAEQIAVLLTLAAGRDLVAAGRSTLLNQLLGTLHDRLHEPELAPLALAQAHGISKRTLHYAFAAAGTTFSQELTRLRLERAHQMLSDVRFADLTITEIAASCGFNESSHFARRFRERFAQTPMQRRALTGAARN
jgi:AraC family transcriptional regulator, positive regulator of tynA and feaB